MKGRGNKREKEEEEEESWSMARKRRSVVEAREHERRDTQKVIREADTEDCARIANTVVPRSFTENHHSSQLPSFAGEHSVPHKIIENASLDQPKSCEHAPLVQPKRGQDAPSSQLRINPVIQGVPADTDSEGEQQEHLQTFAERLRAKPVRECVRDAKKLQRRLLYIGRGASHTGCARSMWANPFQTKRFRLEGALARFDNFE